MAENAGNVTGLMTVATEPLAMGVGSLMSRGAAAGGKGLRAGLVNAMNNQGMSNELARRIAAGGSAGIASQVGKNCFSSRDAWYRTRSDTRRR